MSGRAVVFCEVLDEGRRPDCDPLGSIFEPKPAGTGTVGVRQLNSGVDSVLGDGVQRVDCPETQVVFLIGQFLVKWSVHWSRS
jgi:hypothetical protein